MRNPSRTAATASALMIGLGVVVFVAVFAQGLKSSFVDSFDEVVRADYVVTGKNYLSLPSDTVRRVRDRAGRRHRRRHRLPAGAGRRQRDHDAAAVRDRPGRLRARVELRLAGRGRRAARASSAPTGRSSRSRRRVRSASRSGRRSRCSRSEGTRATFDVLGIYRDPMMLNGITVSTAAFNTLFPRPQLFMVLATAGGESDADHGGDRGRAWPTCRRRT